MLTLILSRSENAHADAVQRELSRRGISMVRLNLDNIGISRPKISVKLGDGATIQIDDILVEARAVNSVFSHHPRITIMEEFATDQLEQRIMSAAWQNALLCLESVLSQATWVNRPAFSGQSLNLMRQLQLAEEIGLATPDTLFTSSKSEALAFSRTHGQVIVKAGPLLGIHLQGKRILTKMLDANDLESLDISLAPCFFQRYIEKAYELRIHVMGNRVYTCRIESQQSAIARHDWRRYDLAHTPHYAHQLDTQIEARCIEITETLGLKLGIIDMIVTPSNQHVFLERNSQGHWIWIEELTGLPITAAVCDLLTQNKDN